MEVVDLTIGGFVQTLGEGERALAIVNGEVGVPENGNLWSPGEVDVFEIDSTCAGQHPWICRWTSRQAGEAG